MPRLWMTTFFVALAGTACSTSGGGDHLDMGVDEGETRQDHLVIESQLRGATLPEKVIHLTFDDGPGARTRELADYLAEQNIVATFFINGTSLSTQRAAVRHLVSRGHLLANHTWSHLLLPRETTDTMVDQIHRIDEVILAEQPGRPLYLRMPYAGYNGVLERALQRSPMNKYIGPIH